MMCQNTQKKSAPLLVVDLITTDRDKKFAPAGRMATAILEIIQKQGCCLPQDLNEKGFTSDEIVQHWHMAHSLANVELNLMNDADTNLKSMTRRK